jgi:hypothetical protein
MSGVPPPMVGVRRRVRGGLSGIASVDVVRRTRRNADTLKGAAAEVTIARPDAVRAGAHPYQRIELAKQIGKPRAASPKCFPADRAVAPIQDYPVQQIAGLLCPFVITTTSFSMSVR